MSSRAVFGNLPLAEKRGPRSPQCCLFCWGPKIKAKAVLSIHDYRCLHLPSHHWFEPYSIKYRWWMITAWPSPGILSYQQAEFRQLFQPHDHQFLTQSSFPYRSKYPPHPERYRLSGHLLPPVVPIWQLHGAVKNVKPKSWAEWHASQAHALYKLQFSSLSNVTNYTAHLPCPMVVTTEWSERSFVKCETSPKCRFL